MVKKIILVFKTHFDIGFTNLSSKVIEQYADSMLKDVITTCKATEHMGNLKYVWTMPSWPLKIIAERCSDDLKKELDMLIERGQIVWHALPFTSHTDFCSAEECIEGLRFGHELSNIYHKPYPISAKMTDVPGHGIMLPDILNGAGVEFLHLGCNEFSTPPKLPFLFYWQALSGKRVLTMYSKGGYGTSLLPPDDWDFPVWMALMHTHDNSGPQSAAVIDKMVQKIHTVYQDVEVVCGTMDEFYSELSQYDLSDIPTITKDLADTWIHGVGAYPLEVGIVREEREKSKRLQAIIAKQELEDVNELRDKKMEKLNHYYENINLFGEHTWGADVKTWLGSERIYSKKEFLEAKNLKNYKFMETSWQEQKDRANHSCDDLDELKILVECNSNNEIFLFNPNNSPYTGWISLKGINEDVLNCGLEINGEFLAKTKIEGEMACYVKNIPSFRTVPVRIVDAPMHQEGKLIIKNADQVITAENHRYALSFSKTSGDILELYDKKLNSALLKKKNNKAIFSYQYDRYGIEDMTTYLRNYAYRFSDWGIKDFGRESYPECKHEIFSPVFRSYSIKDNAVVFVYRGKDSSEKYGDAEEVRLEIVLPPVGDELFVNLYLKNKQETPFVESGSFLLPFGEDEARYKINKSNVAIDPSTDIQEDANSVLYCIENYMTMMGEQNGLCVIAKDSPLVAFGDTGIFKHLNKYKESTEPVAYFDLFNNMWGTNFPQWIGGDLKYRYVLFGFEKEQEDTLMERAAVLKEGIELTGNRLDKDFGKLPDHMQLINVRNNEEGLVLRLKDLSGKKATRSICIKECNITQIDLKNAAIGESSKEKLDFEVKPYGIYSFLLAKVT